MQRLLWGGEVAGTRAYARKGRQIFLGGRRTPRRAARRSRAALRGGAAKPRRAPSGAARREAASPCGAGGVQGLCSSPARLQKRGDAAGKGLLGKNEALCDIAGKRQGVWGAIEGAAERLDPRVAAVGH